MDNSNRIVVIRRNLICAIKLASKYLVDRASSSSTILLDEHIPEVSNLCIILENMLFLGLKGESSALSGDHRRHPWDLISRTVSKMTTNCVKVIDRVENFKNYYAKLRGWLRMALMEKRLQHYVEFVARQGAAVRQYYVEESLLLSSDLKHVIKVLVDLSDLDFSFDLKGEDLNQLGIHPVDYTPYFKVIFRDRTGSVDGIVATECKEHDDDTCPLKQEYQELQGQTHAAIESKNFMSHLLASKDEDLTALGLQLETSNNTVDQLKIQMALLHEQYQQTVRSLGGNVDILLLPTDKILQHNSLVNSSPTPSRQNHSSTGTETSIPCTTSVAINTDTQQNTIEDSSAASIKESKNKIDETISVATETVDPVLESVATETMKTELTSTSCATVTLETSSVSTETPGAADLDRVADRGPTESAQVGHNLELSQIVEDKNDLESFQTLNKDESANHLQTLDANANAELSQTIMNEVNPQTMESNDDNVSQADVHNDDLKDSQSSNKNSLEPENDETPIENTNSEISPAV